MAVFRASTSLYYDWNPIWGAKLNSTQRCNFRSFNPYSKILRLLSFLYCVLHEPDGFLMVFCLPLLSMKRKVIVVNHGIFCEVYLNRTDSYLEEDILDALFNPLLSLFPQESSLLLLMRASHSAIH